MRFGDFGDADRRFAERGLKIGPPFAGDHKVSITHDVGKTDGVQYDFHTRLQLRRGKEHQSRPQPAGCSGPGFFRHIAPGRLPCTACVFCQPRIQLLHHFRRRAFLRPEYRRCAASAAQRIIHIAGDNYFGVF